MAPSPVFPSTRKQLVATLLLAAGSTALGACKGQEAAYRPAPRSTAPATTSTQPARPAPTYAAPSSAPAPTYTPPPPTPVPAQKPGAVACGSGKCG